MTTGKERILAALTGRSADVTPAAIDYMRLYLAERIERAYLDTYRPRIEGKGRLRLDPDEDVHIRAQAILRAHACFQEHDDWLQVIGGPAPERVSHHEIVRQDGNFYELDRSTGRRRRMLSSGQETKTKEMQEQYERTGSGAAEPTPAKQLLADYRARWEAERGDMRLVRQLVAYKGRDDFVYTGHTIPFGTLRGLLGFERLMTGVYDEPALLFYLMDYLLDFAFEKAQAFKDAGGIGVRLEDCLASADLISPQIYEKFVYPYELRLCGQLRRMGLKTILYFCGDVMPRLPYLRQLPIDALMVEESKKDFAIDIGEVRQAVGPELCLLGNLDVYEIVLKATPADFESEVARQIRVAGQNGRFIVGIGSPLTLDTPPERADLLVSYARRHHGSIFPVEPAETAFTQDTKGVRLDAR